MIESAAVTLTVNTRREDHVPALACQSYAMIYALGAALLHEHFPEVIACGDEGGIEFLRALGIPFHDYIRIDVPAGYEFVWSAGKLYAYQALAARGKPFLHVDLDAYWFHRPARRFLEAAVVAQNEEPFGKGAVSPYQVWYSIAQYRALAVRSPELDTALARETWRPLNMGSFGGNDLKFIARYAQDAIETMLCPENLPTLKMIDGRCSIFLEQFLIWAHAEHHGVRPTTLLSWNRSLAGDQLFDSTLQWADLGYCHLFGQWKSWASVHRFVRRYLRAHYRDVFFRVLDLTRGWSIDKPQRDPKQPVRRLWKGPTLWAADHLHKRARELLTARQRTL